MKKYVLLLTSLLSVQAFCQTALQQNAGEILLSLNKLNTLGSVLYMAAHPDDENTRLLAYLASEKKVRTAYLSLTRGDGGQNLIGKEQGEPLGLIRTQELLAARRTDGAEQFFTRANDFGFSKNPEETFAIWNHDSVLSDVVLAIRKFRPDVIICRFPTTGEGGHGHHTASAILALEAFSAAADPSKFPQQLKYAGVWQARRIYWNTFNFGSTNTTAPNQLKIDVGVFNPLLGKSYGEIASESRSMHKSQGFGSARQRGSNTEYFKLLKGDSVKNDLLEGINLEWSKLKNGGKIQKAMERCIREFNAQAPEKTVKDLVAVYKYIQELDDAEPNARYWKQKKLKETESLILSCSGLWLEAFAAEYIAIPGKTMSVTAQVVNRNGGEATLKSISFLQQADSATNLLLKKNELYTFKNREALSSTTAFSNPYWLNEAHEQGLYTVTDPWLINTAQNDPATKVYFNIHVQGLDLKIARDVVYKYTDPVKGEIYRPLEILPPATVNFPEKAFVFAGAQPKAIRVTVKANADNVVGSITLATDNAASSMSVVTGNRDFKLKNKGDEAVIDATITPTEMRSTARGTPVLLAHLFIDGGHFSKSIKRIEYDHIPYQFILSEAGAPLIRVELQKKEGLVGYIPGAGDEVPACLKQVGYQVTVLTDELLAVEDLSKYSAIVTGIRAYNTNDHLQQHSKKLMAYVENGGNLIAQYNTNSRVGPLQASIGPYPFTISRDRVTDEEAEVRIKNENHPALSSPNKITAADFKGWVQERGIYFATELDGHYETVLSMNDAGEKASEGSLIISKYGKGNFVYTGLAFFRQLPAGVPGAYRLFVNLLSLPQN
jgi:LmbE family N-acetylglucosaminyl deacetylase